MAKVLFVLTSLGQGGAEQYTLRYINYDRENEFTVMTTMGIGGVLEADYRKVSNVVLGYKFGHLNVSNWAKVYKFLKLQKFDTIVDMHGSMSGIMMWLAKRAGVENRIAFYRNTNAGYSPNWYKNLYERISIRLMTKCASKVFSNSCAALDKHHPNWKSRPEIFKVIYNGLDMKTLSAKSNIEEREALDIPENVFVIGHSARVEWQKNHSMILACADRLCKKYDDVIFLLMGIGTDTKLREEVMQRGLQYKVRLMGNRRDVLDILKSLNLYYFPSVSEGQPNALIEAMASGVPILASKIDSIMETVPDYIKPNLVSPEDEDANSHMLEKLYLNPVFREQQKCEVWARDHYDSAKNFELLKKEL